VAEPTNEAEQEAASLPDGNDDTAPSSASGPADRSGHPTRRHREPAPHTSDGDRAGTSPASTGYQDTAHDATDAASDLPNRDYRRPSGASQREAESTGQCSERASDRSAELTEASSHGQQWARRNAPHPPGHRRDAASERNHSSSESSAQRPHGGHNPSSGTNECPERDEQK
jgi:hypothetical protein